MSDAFERFVIDEVEPTASGALKAMANGLASDLERDEHAMAHLEASIEELQDRLEEVRGGYKTKKQAWIKLVDYIEADA